MSTRSLPPNLALTRVCVRMYTNIAYVHTHLCLYTRARMLHTCAQTHLYLCARAHMHTCMYAQAHTTHIYMHVSTCTHTYNHTSMFVHTYTHLCLRVRVYTDTHTWMCRSHLYGQARITQIYTPVCILYLYTHTPVHISVSVSIHTHRHRHVCIHTCVHLYRHTHL